MRKALLYSFAVHVLVLIALLIGGLGFSSPRPPVKVYRIKVVNDPEPPEEKKVEKKDTGDVKPAPPVKVERIKPKKKKREEPPEKEEVSKRPKVKEEPEEKKGVGGVELEGEEFPFPYYLELFVGKIRKNWKNPVRDPDASLSAEVYFRITKTGRITDVRLKKGSGRFVYDQAALRAVLASNPLPPLPEGYERDFLGVTCEIIP